MTRAIDTRTTASMQRAETFVLRFDRYGLWHWTEARRLDPERTEGIVETGRAWMSLDAVDVTVAVSPSHLIRAREIAAGYPSIEAALLRLVREEGDAIAARHFAESLVADVPCVARGAVVAQALVAAWPIETAGLVVRLVRGAHGEIATTAIVRLGDVGRDHVTLAVLLPAARRAEAMARLGARPDDDTVVRVITGIVRAARSAEPALEDTADTERGAAP